MLTIFFEYLVPCEVAEYKMHTTEYDDDGLISGRMNKIFTDIMNITIPNATKTNSVLISFVKTEIDVSEEVSFNNFSYFLSAVGGNLGLFTGISFLSLLLTLAEWIKK